jgi:hypothetical protein
MRFDPRLTKRIAADVPPIPLFLTLSEMSKNVLALFSPGADGLPPVPPYLGGQKEAAASHNIRYLFAFVKLVFCGFFAPNRA